MTRIEPSSGAVASQPIPVGDDPYGVAVDPDNPDLIFVVNRGDNTVSVIDRVDRDLLGEGFVTEPEIEVGERPKAVVIADGVGWVTNTDDGSVSRIDATGEPPFEASTVTGVCDQPRDIAFGFEAIWVSCAEGAVARIDPAANEHATIDLGDIEGSPEGIAVGNRAVWVAMGEAGTVVPIEPEG